VKIPRDLSARELIHVLEPLGYSISRQRGSHIRLTTAANGEHHVTLPNHSPIKLGTLNSILSGIAEHHLMSREELISLLFG